MVESTKKNPQTRLCLSSKNSFLRDMSGVKYCTLCGAALYDKSGAECRQLYDEDLHAKSGILKLVPCHACGADVADKYVEVDGTLLLIDLALQSKSAYRHVLLNASTSNAAAVGRTTSVAGLVYKVALLTVICDGSSWLCDNSGHCQCHHTSLQPTETQDIGVWASTGLFQQVFQLDGFALV